MHGRRPTISSTKGVVAAAHPLAAQAGARLLGSGGNAFDAAVATAAALNVVEPYMSGLAGQGLATCWIAAERRVRVLDFVPCVPQHFPVERFKVREDLARGPLSAGVPGNLAGWAELARAHGRKPLGDALTPAISLARDGFPLVEFNVDETNEHGPAIQRYPFSAEFTRVYMNGGSSVAAGAVLKQPDLAATLEHLAIVYRAIRLAAGVRINRNNPPPQELARLLDEEHVAMLRARVRDRRPIAGPTEQWMEPPASGEDPGHTTSFSIGDSEGNLVCVTQSLGSPYGSGVVVPGTGVCLNNFLYWTEVNPKSPNRTAPGAELPICMSPSISTRDGLAVLALGTPGSYGILQTQAQAMVQYRDFGLALQDAIEPPRARLWDGAFVQVEGRVAPEAIAALRERGHDAVAFFDWTMKVGGMQAVAVDPATGVITGAADPRRDSYAVAL